MSDRRLVLVRHGESEGNRQNIFTGWRDLDLTIRGVDEARAVGRLLASEGLRFGAAFASALLRARRTADIILDDLGQPLAVEPAPALNERDYGELTGLNKDEARQRWGEEQVRIWRRSYDLSPPGGESLRDTTARVLPYYIHRVLPAVMSTGPVLLVAHGNSLRALVSALDGLKRSDIPALEIATGEVISYRLADDTSVLERSSRRVDEVLGLKPELAP